MNTQTLDQSFPNSKFRVIYADPPWAYQCWSKKGEGRSAEHHYNTMNIDDINKLPVSSIADKDSILFMWATAPLMDEQLKCMENWGFEYKTFALTWIKKNKVTNSNFIGMGYYTRSNPEFLLIGTRGKPGRPKDKGISSVIESRIREHSQKPDEVYDLIERMYDGPYIELFARTKHKGWECWGNQTDKFSTLYDFIPEENNILFDNE